MAAAEQLRRRPARVVMCSGVEWADSRSPLCVRRVLIEQTHLVTDGGAAPSGRGLKGHAPPGWPPEVLPPDAERWQQSAVEWFLDFGDPAWRLDGTLRRQPLVLAQFARRRAHAHVAAARALWRELPELAVDAALPEGGTSAVRTLLEREGRRLADRVAAVDLVADALRGQRWVPRL